MAMDSKGNVEKSAAASNTVYCQGIARTTLADGTLSFGHGGDTLGFRARCSFLERSFATRGVFLGFMMWLGWMHGHACVDMRDPIASLSSVHFLTITSMDDVTTLKAKLMWIAGTDSVVAGAGKTGGCVVAAMTNVGTMHTGLAPSAFDLFFDNVLLPAVRAAAPHL
jgi:hypothetical protein